jgi:hypothetical protein
MLEEARMAKLVSLSVIGASQKNVTGADVWAAVRKKSAQVIIEVATEPKNAAEEWKLIKWTGGKAVKGKLNQRAVDRDAASKVTIKAEYGETTRTVEIWIVSASIEILTKGPRPKGAAPRDAGTRDGTEKLGAVTFPTLFQNGINDSIAEDDPDPKHFVVSTGASGKIIAVATLKPAGVSKVIKAGWTFRRQIMARDWQDGIKFKSAKTWTDTWADDTSGPTYLRLTPDEGDKIYDLDEPDLRFGRFSSETYNNFQQWVEWNGEICSDFAPWYWQAIWRAKADTKAQIELNKCDAGKIELPKAPKHPPRKTP